MFWKHVIFCTPSIQVVKINCNCDLAFDLTILLRRNLLSPNYKVNFATYFYSSICAKTGDRNLAHVIHRQYNISTLNNKSQKWRFRGMWLNMLNIIKTSQRMFVKLEYWNWKSDPRVTNLQIFCCCCCLFVCLFLFWLVTLELMGLLDNKSHTNT